MTDNLKGRTPPGNEETPIGPAVNSHSESGPPGRSLASGADQPNAQDRDQPLDSFSLLKQNLRKAFDRHDRALKADDLDGAKTATAEAERALSDWFQRSPVDNETMKLFDQAKLLIEKTKLPRLNIENLNSDMRRLPQGGLDLGQYSIYRTTAAGVSHVQHHEQVAPITQRGSNEILGEQLTWPSFTAIAQFGLFGAGVGSLRELLLDALSILASQTKPLFARHVARHLANNICSLLISGPRLGELEMGRVMAIGVWAEQMRVAIGQRDRLNEKKNKVGREKGGEARARKESAKTRLLQKRLNEIARKEKCNKTEACERLASEPDVSLAVTTLMKKLKDPNRSRAK